MDISAGALCGEHGEACVVDPRSRDEPATHSLCGRVHREFQCRRPVALNSFGGEPTTCNI